MNIAELKEAIADLDDDLELRVNLFNKVTVGVESVDFTTYVDSDEEIACIVMEGDEEKTEPAPVVAASAEETATTFQDRMKSPEDSPAQAALAVDAANKPAGGVSVASLTGQPTDTVDKEGDAQ